MKINNGFNSWNTPYLFQAMEDTMASFTEEQRARIISLGIGDPDIETPAPIRRRIMQEHREVYHGYPTAQGRLDLREAISKYYQNRFNVQVSAREVFVGSGAKTDLFDLNAVFSRPGDSVVILDPAYPVYRDAALYRGNKIVYISGTLANRYQPELPDETQLHDLALIYLCYPNNPTGADADADYIQSMIDLARKHKAMIVMDIAYADFVPGNTPSSAFSIFQFPGGDEVGIEVASFSKPFSMTGDRISWVTIKNPEAARFWHRYRANRDSGASNYDQVGALEALTSPEVKSIVHENFNTYGRRARILKDGLDTLGFQWTGLTNTPYAWFKVPGSDDIETARKILEEVGVILTPGSGFGPAGRGFLRATVFQPESRLEEAISRLKRFDFESA